MNAEFCFCRGMLRSLPFFLSLEGQGRGQVDASPSCSLALDDCQDYFCTYVSQNEL